LYDENLNEIQVKNLTQTPIELWIPRDTSDATIVSFVYKLVNILNVTKTTTTTNTSILLDGGSLVNGFITNGFQLSGLNVSIHMQIKPVNVKTAYLSLLKFGSNPTLANSYYDIINILCPQDLMIDSENNDSYYLLFVNVSRVNQFNGYVGYSLAQLGDTSTFNCLNTSVEALLNLTKNSSFTSNYYQRIFLSGCYYLDATSSYWSSYGMDIYSDSNLTHAHCKTNHLTTFASGFIVLPSAINFSYVWSHASFLQTPVIYSTVIVLVCVYVLLSIWARWMDWKDSRKFGITILPYSNDFCGEIEKPINKYAYEIIVFTGQRPNAGTKSNVTFCFTYF